jgi:dTDP-4-amino-4,6-dideoxygalactose transaminase
MPIPVFRPTLRRRDFNSVLSCLVSDRIGGGPLCSELAAELARYVGAAGAACLSTFGLAMDCALEALELAAGDAVVVSALAPGAYLSALAGRGLKALLADVDPATGVVRRSEVERCLASAPKALVLHYPLGLVPETEELFSLGLPVLEDVSQALGSWYGGAPGAETAAPAQEPVRRCGGLGQVSVLSLGPEGIITAGCGAAVFARERKTARGLREAVERLGRDALLADMNAALGLAQLREIESFLRSRRAIAEIFTQAVARSRHGRLGPLQDGAAFAFPVVVKDGVKQVRQFAMKRNIETSMAFAEAVAAIGQAPAGEAPPEPRPEVAPKAEAPLPPAEAAPGSRPLPTPGAGAEAPTPAARDLLQRCVLFPLYPTLLKRDVQLIAKVLSALP